MTSYGDIIKQGRSDVGKEVKDDIGKVVNAESGKAAFSDAGGAVDDKPVNITIKVPRKSRQYWTSQCKLQGVTMTEVLVEALIERFGPPPSQ